MVIFQIDFWIIFSELLGGRVELVAQISISIYGRWYTLIVAYYLLVILLILLFDIWIFAIYTEITIFWSHVFTIFKDGSFVRIEQFAYMPTAKLAGLCWCLIILIRVEPLGRKLSLLTLLMVKWKKLTY